MKTKTVFIVTADDNMWLYKDNGIERQFAKNACNTDDSWKECTNEEKELWEKEHTLIPDAPDDVSSPKIL